MVGTYFDETYLLNNIESNIKVIDVKRMTKKTIDLEGNSKIIKRQVVILIFLRSSVPQRVKINLVNFPVENYIYPVVQCFKCLRYGHTNKQCKGNKRCSLCSEEHEK